MTSLRNNWKWVLAFTVVAFVAIGASFIDYPGLQMASSADDFRATLDGHTARASAAVIGDMAFSLGYSLLALAVCEILNRSRAAVVATALVLFGGVMDVVENAFVFRNVNSHETIGDGAIDAMQVPGTLKWFGVFGGLVLIVLVIQRAVMARR
jgi:hypothetical protein